MTQCVRKINCIVCPISCVGEITSEDGQIQTITGFACDRGKKYAKEEMTSPKRTLTTTVKVLGGALPLLPVVSKLPLPKDRVMACAQYLSTVSVEAPVVEGDIICPNILGLKVDIVATRDMPIAQQS
ncbi:MAG: DUF1667 domain-containing protein [Sporomusa sp.]